MTTHLPSLLTDLRPLQTIANHTHHQSFLEYAMGNLIDAAKKHPENRQRFAKFRWQSLESSKSSHPLKEAVFSTLSYTMPNAEAEVIFSHFRTHTNAFDFASFLLAFATRYESNARVQPPVTPAPATSTPLHDHVMQLWRKARAEATAVSAAKGFVASIEDKSRQRALLALDEALRKRISNRFHENLSLIESMGHIPRKDFRSAMRNGLDLNLTAIESNCLFDVFDTNGDGIVSSKELSDAIHRMMHESKKRIHNEEFASKRLHNRRSSSTKQLGSRTFNRDEFKRAVVLLTDSVTPTSSLWLPDEMLAQHYIRKCIYEQVGVRLNAAQMQCLCHKLTRAHPADDTSGRSTNSAATATTTDSSEDVMSDGPVNGRIIQNFYVQLQKYIGAKIASSVKA